MSTGLLAFFIALFASLVLTVPVRALALRVGMVDLPGPRKVHLQPIPLLGGLAMYGGVMLAIIFAFDGAARAQSVGIVTGATLVAAVGFLDDRGWLHHQIKLFVGMPLAACILLASGIHAQAFELVVPGQTGYALDAALTIFDTTLVTISRARRGLLPFAAPGKDHAAHRLANLGMGQRGAVLALYLLGIVSGALAVLVCYISATAALLLAVLVIAAMLVAIAMLEKAPFERQTSKAGTL